MGEWEGERAARERGVVREKADREKKERRGVYHHGFVEAEGKQAEKYPISLSIRLLCSLRILVLYY